MEKSVKTKDRSTRNLQKVQRRWFFIFISPWVIGFICFQAGPIIASLVLSFTDYALLSPPSFVGAKNYITMITVDPIFWKSLKVTMLYTAGSVPLGIVVGLSIAILLNQKIKGLALFRTIYYLPAVISGVAVALLWRWIYTPNVGLLNSMLAKVGIEGPAWLFSETWALVALIIMSIWGTGAGIIIYLAGLQGIPTGLYEVALIDGANNWQKFWHITLPMMSSVIFFMLIMGIIGSFQVFTFAYVMTGGGPNYATMFYGLYVYFSAFSYLKMGYAGALAWVLFLITLTSAAIIFKYIGGRVYYRGGA